MEKNIIDIDEIEQELETARARLVVLETMRTRIADVKALFDVGLEIDELLERRAELIATLEAL